MRILVTGASGTLGSYVIKHLAESGHQVHAWSGSTLGQRAGIPLEPIDLAELGRIRVVLDRIDPSSILHLAAISAAAECLRDPVRANTINVAATSAIAEWCDRRDRHLVFTSTDLVFSGEKAWNREEDPTGPTTLYGRMKASAERVVQGIHRGLVARMPLMFGPSISGKSVFFDQALTDLRNGKPRTFFEDEYRTPLDYATAASLLVRLAERDDSGILHVAGSDRMSRFELMMKIAKASEIDSSLVRANRREDSPGPEPRPADVSLSNLKLRTLFPDFMRPDLEQIVRDWH